MQVSQLYSDKARISRQFIVIWVILSTFVKNHHIMSKLSTKSNHGFLFGSFILMIMLFLIIFIFLMWAFKAFDKQEKITKYRECYEIVLEESTLNKPMTLFINDSLIYSGTPVATTILRINRFAEESTILAVDDESSQVSLIALPKESSQINLHRNGTEFTSGHK